MNNLKQIGLASIMWAQDHGDHFPTTTSVTNGGTLELAATGPVYLHFLALSNYLIVPRVLHCKVDTTRIAPLSFTNLADTNLSYFAALDPTTNTPSSTILAGDRNLTNPPSPGSRFVEATKTTILGWDANLHHGYGDVAFTDGHVEGLSNRQPRPTAAGMPDGATNRLAIP